MPALWLSGPESQACLVQLRETERKNKTLLGSSPRVGRGTHAVPRPPSPPLQFLANVGNMCPTVGSATRLRMLILGPGNGLKWHALNWWSDFTSSSSETVNFSKVACKTPQLEWVNVPTTQELSQVSRMGSKGREVFSTSVFARNMWARFFPYVSTRQRGSGIMESSSQQLCSRY
uniref:Uncharacterized protein n=1 Tax=Sphaerodactylus townsendi TaxID=933632 RepID=A0ACB8EIE7_9SAUR